MLQDNTGRGKWKHNIVSTRCMIFVVGRWKQLCSAYEAWQSVGLSVQTKLVVTDLYLHVKRVKVKPLQQTWASKCLPLRDQAKLFTKNVPLGPIFALQHPISSSTPSIFAGKTCRYSDKSDNNNITVSIVYKPDVRWLLVRTGKPSAEHWQEEIVSSN